MIDPNEAERRVVVGTTGRPATVASLAGDLRSLGLADGSTVLVHSSVSALGWVVGGGEAVLLAIEAAVGRDGTVMMPAYSMSAPEPSSWVRPPVPDSWWELIRTDWPPFDPVLSPARRLGEVPELFRHQEGTVRSAHPNDSFCARGPNAERLVGGHSLDSAMGDGSPLARLYELDGLVLLLGVDHGSNSSLHLAEYRAPWSTEVAHALRRARLTGRGTTLEVSFDDVELDSDDFAELGRELELLPGAVRTGPVGAGVGRLMRQRAAVDFAIDWLPKHRRTEIRRRAQPGRSEPGGSQTP
ncbi:MAG TPA: AAC(3) family N-acetyltransferase [Thermoplasmata archaeon]|nr:AAC(3) family N-acetyltransferase [Thermoplasmata archaeon]